MDSVVSLKRKKVSELLYDEFVIPTYQRGYRWTKEQVRQLLDDIWSFHPEKTASGETFYCLQPVVVRSMGEGQLEVNGKKAAKWELIDGQQRLTTIHIIMVYCNYTTFKKPKQVFPLEYNTRPELAAFFRHLEDDNNAAASAEASVDCKHIYNAYQEISHWFAYKELEHPNIQNDFYSKLVEKVQVIWFESSTNSDDDGKHDAIDIFTRLNIGKIELTNAELIKALLLQNSNFAANQSQGQHPKQIEIALEWDTIEAKLRDEKLWYFLSDYDHAQHYDASRIEYVLDMMVSKQPSSERYFTFNTIQEKLNSQNGDVNAIWLEIKNYFRVLEEWFNDYEMYHLIGFLITCGHKLNALVNLSRSTPKKNFKAEVLARIQKEFTITDIEELSYGEGKGTGTIRKLLLLFNIGSYLKHKSDIYFPFYRYKEDQWDVEHVRSQSSEVKCSSQDRQKLAISILEYLTQAKYSDEEILGFKHDIAKIENKEERSICNAMLKYASEKDEDKDLFDNAFKKLRVLFKETDDDGVDGIANLALLDANTNRSYKNALFPLKRKMILERDKEGQLIPICTKNVFIKAYSKDINPVPCWTKEDAEAYLTQMKEILSEFLPELVAPKPNAEELTDA